MKGRGEDPEAAAATFQAAFNSEYRTQALVILVDWLETIRRVVLFERGADGIRELECLTLVMDDLLVALKVDVGIGPFDSWDFEEVLNSMTREFHGDCAELSQEAISFAAQQVKRLLPID